MLKSPTCDGQGVPKLPRAAKMTSDVPKLDAEHSEEDSTGDDDSGKPTLHCMLFPVNHGGPFGQCEGT